MGPCRARRGQHGGRGSDTLSNVDWPAFWTAAFASSGAALVGLVSAVLVFRRTRAADQRDAAIRERRERIAAVHGALWGDLAPRLTMRWRQIGTAPLPLAKALTDVIVAGWGDHPAVALWATEQLEDFTRRIHAAERGWLLPGHQRRRGKLMRSVSTTVSMLMGWDAGLIADDWFAGQLSKKSRRLLPSPHRRRLWRSRSRA